MSQKVSPPKKKRTVIYDSDTDHSLPVNNPSTDNHLTCGLNLRMYNGVEVIDFTRPDGSRRNLFITNIPASLHEDDIVSLFHTIFGKYGLIYGVQVFPFKWQLDDKKTVNQSGGYYGFVTFYSSLSAAMSKEDLNNKVVIEGNECKISFAKRKKKVQESPILHFTRCRELANYYLGFNGWSSQIKLLYEETGQAESVIDMPSVKYVCVVRLDFPHQKLHTDGMGAWHESYIKQDPASRGRAVCKCKKLAFQRALENSFSRVLLIILSNGKVTVEIDTTKPEILPQELQDEEAVIKVNNLDEDPGFDGEKDVEAESIAVTMEDLDLNNLDILQQLEGEI